MNTKTDQISSGLVAHIAAFKEALNGTKGDLDAWLECNDESEVRQAIFGIISDAEAIISDLQNLVIAENQRKQQLEAEVMRLKAAQPNIVLIADKDAVISQQSKRIEELTDDLEESDAIRDRCAHLLAETAVALKGPEKALHRHGWQDLPEVAAKQSAALKLAKDAFSAINIEAKTFMSYENARNNFSDDTDERKAYERAMVKASELTKKAIAAINVLKGE